MSLPILGRPCLNVNCGEAGCVPINGVPRCICPDDKDSPPTKDLKCPDKNSINQGKPIQNTGTFQESPNITNTFIVLYVMYFKSCIDMI